LSSRLLSRNIKVKIYRTIIMPVVLYGYETWSLTSREEERLAVFENRVLRRIFEPKTDEVTGEWRKLHSGGAYHHISLGRSNLGGWGRRGLWHAWQKTEKCTRFWCESPKERDHFEDRGVEGRMELE
jgi:hypothetical protein